MSKPACVAIGHLHSADMEVLALLVRAALAAVPKAQCLAVVRQRQAFHGRIELCHLSIVFEVVCLCLPCLAFAVTLLPLGAFADDDGRFRARLEQCVYVAAYFSQFVQCLIKRPAFAVQCGYLVPEAPVCRLL